MTRVSRQNQDSQLTAAFWQEQKQKHPTFYALLTVSASVADFFFNGHFIKATGRWIIRVGGYVAETVLMFAVLWITCASVAPQLMELFMSKAVMQYLIWLSLATLALIPEIILASAIVNAVSHWLTIIRDRRNVGAWIWAILFTLPTILFFLLTAVTLNTLGANGGNLVQASTDTLNLRLDAGWIYGLLELTYAGVQRSLPQSHIVNQAVPVSPTPDEVAQRLVPLLVPHFDELRKSILTEVQHSVPLSQINHQEIAQALVPLLPVPVVPEVDPQEIAQAVAPLLRPAFVEVRRTIIEEVKAIVPQMAASPVPPQIEAARNVSQQATHAQIREDSDLDREMRLERAYQDLVREGKKPSANLLYVRASCNRRAAQQWLRSRRSGTESGGTGTSEVEAVPRDLTSLEGIHDVQSHLYEVDGHEATPVGGTPISVQPVR